MTRKDPFKEFQKYLKKNPELKKIIKQLEVDEKSYFMALKTMKSNVIVPRTTLSNRTYKF